MIPFLSIITPVFNREALVSRVVESVLDSGTQTLSTSSSTTDPQTVPSGQSVRFETPEFNSSSTARTVASALHGTRVLPPPALSGLCFSTRTTSCSLARSR